MRYIVANPNHIEIREAGEVKRYALEEVAEVAALEGVRYPI